MIKKFFIFLAALSLGVFFSQIVKYKINSVENDRLSQSEMAEPQNNHELSDLSEDIENSKQENPERINKRFGTAGVDDDKEIKDLYLKFQKAVAENDRKTVSSLMIYPLRVYFPTDVNRIKYRFIKNGKEFLKVYDKIFNDELKNFIAGIDVESENEIWATVDGIAVGHGTIWIGVFCNDNLCENGNYIKIRTIHGNSNLMDDYKLKQLIDK